MTARWQLHPSSRTFGVALPTAAPIHQLQIAVDALDVSVDAIWLTDRIVASVPWFDTLTTLGWLASATNKAMIGTSVLVLARRNPALAAHALATADCLSNGRVIAGIGLGGLEPKEFQINGVDPAERGELTDEYISIVRKLWKGKPVDYERGAVVLQQLNLSPTPNSPIPIWTGGSSPAALRRAGRLADGWIGNFTPPAAFAAATETIKQHAADAGHGRTIVPAVHLFASIAPTRSEAIGVISSVTSSVFGTPYSSMSFACLAGEPADWVSGITGYHEAGAAHVIAQLFTANFERDVALIAEQVAPAIRAIKAA